MRPIDDYRGAPVFAVDIRDGLPSLTIRLDGKGLPSGIEVACARALIAAQVSVVSRKRITVAIRSGALKLCPDDFRLPRWQDALGRAIIAHELGHDDLRILFGA